MKLYPCNLTAKGKKLTKGKCALKKKLCLGILFETMEALSLFLGKPLSCGMKTGLHTTLRTR